MNIPEDVVLGAATASYQIEGAATEGGRLPSVWDTFSHTPGKTLGGHTGDVAVDHYHRLDEDLDLMAELGLEAYRFSIAWPRIVPTGSGKVNEEGVDFYSRLVDGLRARSIRPVATLYHWDLPQVLEDRGGWLVRDTAAAFADYAGAIAARLGDRVDTWTTLNEPWCAAYLGYGNGVHAPGRTGREEPLRAVHQLNRAHGLAAQALRAAAGSGTRVSVTHNLNVTRPYGPTGPAAVRKVLALANDVFLGPQLDGEYPESVIDTTKDVTDWGFVEPSDLADIRQPLDALGVNYYATGLVRLWDGTGVKERADGHAHSGGSPWPGAEDVEFLPQPGPHTEMGWNVEPQGIYDLLMSLHASHPGLPLWITENGAAYADEVVVDGRIQDDDRIDYVRRHIDEALRAKQDGADVRAYFLWSLLDNFEWSWGYSKRFGIVHVDAGTLARTPKASADWYARVIRTRLTSA